MRLYTAKWCINCKAVKRIVEADHPDVEVIDIDENPEIAEEAGVKSLPTLADDTGNTYVGTNKCVTFLVNLKKGIIDDPM